MRSNHASVINRSDGGLPTMPVLIHHYRVDELSQGHASTQYNGYDLDTMLRTVATLCMELTEGTIVVYRDGAPTRHIEVK